MILFLVKVMLIAMLISDGLGHEAPSQDTSVTTSLPVISGDGSDQTYGVIIDCGSSGSRAHIFRWKSSLEYPDLLEHLSPLISANGEPVVKHVQPGLSSFRDRPEDSAGYIKQLADFVTQNVPTKNHGSTNIYIMGTAGMRLLDNADQKAIWSTVKNYVENNYIFGKVEVGVISGPMEGVYQWISVNSKARRFLTSSVTDYRDTYSVIEMGGASIQVTFQVSTLNQNYIARSLGFTNPRALRAFDGQLVSPSISERDKNSEPLELASITFLGLGSNSARKAYIDMLIREAMSFRKFNFDRLLDPCLPIGARETHKKPKRILYSARTIGFEADDHEESITVGVVGIGHHSLCRENLIRLLNIMKTERNSCRADEPCSSDLIGENFIPYESLRFVGISDIFYTMNEVIDMAGTYRRPSIIEKTAKICETPFKKLMRKYNDANEKDEDRVLTECFKATWVEVFLSFGINVPYNYKGIEVVGSIGGQRVDWTLGAVLDRSLAVEKSESKTTPNPPPSKKFRWRLRP